MPMSSTTQWLSLVRGNGLEPQTHLEVDLEELVHQEQHAPLLGVLNASSPVEGMRGAGRSQEALSEQRWGPPHSCLRVTGADTEAAHEQLSRFLQHVPNLALPLLHQLLICLRATFLLGPGWPEDSCTHDWSHVWLPSWWPRQPRHSASVLWCRQSDPVGHFLLVIALQT